jgi:type I restriction enzyme M protein
MTKHLRQILTKERRVTVSDNGYVNNFVRMPPLVIQSKKSDRLTDYITGSEIADTPENRVMLKIEHLLVDQLDYTKNEVKVKKRILVNIGRQRFEPEADLVVFVDDKPIQVIEAKAPGEDLRAWREQALSYAKVHEPPIPIAVITTYDETEVWHVYDHKLLAESISAVIPRSKALELSKGGFRQLTSSETETAMRTLITFVNPKEFANVFGQCHNILRSQKGLDPRQRLYEMCKIVLTKMYEEEREEKGEENRFNIKSIENDERLGGNASQFIDRLFAKVKEDWLKGLFSSSEKIDLKAHTIKEIVRLLEPYTLRKTREDVLGVAFEIFLKGTMTGKDLGEFFTPREIVDFMVEMVDPQFGEKILDPACGSGGFLIKSFFHVLDQINTKKEKKELIEDCLWGIDIYEYLQKLSSINLKIHGDGYKHIYRADSLDLVDVGKQDKELEGLEEENREAGRPVRDVIIQDGGFDVILTNPPFGSGKGKDITEERILEKYEMGKHRLKQIPQILFIELCLKLLKPGGRMAIVLPDSILNNLGKDYLKIREFILKHTTIVAIISIPPGAFVPYGSGIKASILYMQKKNREKPRGEVFASSPKFIGYETHTKVYKQIPQNDFIIVKQAFRSWWKGNVTEDSQ